MPNGNNIKERIENFSIRLESWVIFILKKKILSLKKSLNLSLFMKFLLKKKTNKDKSTEIVLPLFHKPTYSIYARNDKNQKRSAKGSNFKEDTRTLKPLLY